LETLIGELGILALLLGLSAFFSGSEVALFSLSKLQINRLSEDFSNKGNHIKTLLNNQKKLLITILLGNECVNVGASVLVSIVINDFMKTAFVNDFFKSIGLAQYAGTAGVAISISMMTFFLLVFGEVTPKAVALAKTEKFALFVVKPVYWFTLATSFLVSIFMWINNLFLKLFRVNDSAVPFITNEELDALVDYSEKNGIIGVPEKEMIDGIVSLSGTTVYSIMTPRMDVIGLDISNLPDDIISFIRENHKSRLPVYEEHIDKVRGVLYVKDLLSCLKNRQPVTIEVIENVMRKPFFVPENKKVDDMLEEMQRDKIVLAVIVDEYGGVEGIVTIEDIMEEIFGEIEDETDIPETEEILLIGKNSLLVNSKVHIEDLEEYFDHDFTGDGYF
jgi:CBS domain containing-hemolysin-like protein